MLPRRAVLRVVPLEDRIAPAFGDFLLTINNPTQQIGGSFGAAVAADGNLVVVGAPINNAGQVLQSGTAHVFNATTGALVATLNNPDPDSHDQFGVAVAISGNRVVVGADSDDPNGVDRAGSAYVYNATTGALVATLNNPNPKVPTAADPNPDTVDFFGNAVAIHGNRVVVGAHWDDNNNHGQSGRAYVFDSETGALVTPLNNPAPYTNDMFGTSVAITGDYAVVGAKWDHVNGLFSPGSVHVFNATTGALIRTLNNPNPATFDEFGISVAASGNLVVVGASGDDPGNVSNAGAAFVYDVTTGALVAALNNPTPAANEAFGSTVAIAGNRAVVGSAKDAVGYSSTGTAYVFDTATGAVVATLSNPAPANFDAFGVSVAISGRRAVAGASGDNSRGAAHLYDAFIPLTLSAAAVGEFRPTGTAVGTLGGPAGPYTLVAGVGSADNGSFAVSGNQLVIARPWDAQVKATYNVRVRASNGTEQAFTITVADHPAVALTGRTLNVTGTAANDDFSFVPGTTDHALTLNGVTLAVRRADVDAVAFQANGGADTATLTAAGPGNAAVLAPGSARLMGPGFVATATGAARATAAGRPADVAYLSDSAGNDAFVGAPAAAVLLGGGFHSEARGFGRVEASASAGGLDVAYQSDSAGNDAFIGTPAMAVMVGPGYLNQAAGFDRAEAAATAGGVDVAYLYDSAGNDAFIGTPAYAVLLGSGFHNEARGFDRAEAWATAGGVDVAYLYDSAGNDAFIGTPGLAAMVGPGYLNQAAGFDRAEASASAGGTDLAYLYDSAGDETFTAAGSTAAMAGPGFVNVAVGFDRVTAAGGNGGVNRRYVDPASFVLEFLGTWV